MKKNKSSLKQIVNRRAGYDYFLEDTLIAGLVLTGAETKSLRLGHGQLSGAYISINNNEAYLINAQVNGTNGIIINEQDQTRSRKLLISKKELKVLKRAKDDGKTIVPLAIQTNSKYIKIKIAIAKGKKKYDKRETKKKRDQERELKRLSS